MNVPSPQVSVLVPIYNVEVYLDRCLASIAAQSFDDFEVICLNDGSTDGSLAVIRSYVDKDPRFRLVNKPNSGYGDTMNQGLALARGSYIAIVESDDFIAAHMLEQLWTAAQKNEVEVVKANCYFYWQYPRARQRLFHLVPRSETGCVIDPAQHTQIFHLTQSIWSALYRRDFLTANAIDFVASPGASYQDAAFNFKVWCAARRVWFVPDALYYYRQDNASSSVASKTKALAVVGEYAAIDAYLATRPEKLAAFGALAQKLKFDAYLWNYERLAPGLKLDFLHLFAAEIREDAAHGRIDRRLYEPWKLYDLDALLLSAEHYHELRLKHGGANAHGRIRFYLSQAGPLVCWRFIWSKLYRAG
jgi:glycosyltransferase involved in cell wall biosynthesis